MDNSKRVSCNNCRFDATLIYLQMGDIRFSSFKCPRCGCGLFNNVQGTKGIYPPNYKGGEESVNRGGKPLISNTK